MKKFIVCFLFAISPSAWAQDLSFLAHYDAEDRIAPIMLDDVLNGSYDDQAISLRQQGMQWLIDPFYEWKNLLFAKEMVKVCHDARHGMAVQYYAPAQFDAAIQSFNRQTLKLAAKPKTAPLWEPYTTANDIPDDKLTQFGYVENWVLSSYEYEIQSDLILAMEFSVGLEVCGQFRAALELAEFGL